MNITRILKQMIVAGALVAGAGAANAGVVTFDGLVDFENYAEAGMEMTSAEVWNYPGEQMAHMDGGEAGFVLSSGNLFSLDSVDMILDGGEGTARFSAYLDGTLLGFADIAYNAGTYNFGELFQSIDELRVSVIDDHFTFDNLAFTEDSTDVPEPAGLALFGLGAAALVARRRKRA